MKGKLREAELKEALLEDVHEDSFARVIQFVLTGVYTAPDPHLLVDLEHTFQDSPVRKSCKKKKKTKYVFSISGPVVPVPEISEGEPPAPELESEPEPIIESAVHIYSESQPITNSVKNSSVEGGAWLFRTKLRSHASEFVQLRRPALEPFNSLSYAKPSMREMCDYDLSNISDAQDFTAIFLCHASLYVFAEKYDIQELRSYAAYRLHRTLAQFTLFMARVPDIVSLMRYTYEHTLQTTNEPLRIMISNFCAWNINLLSHNDEFLAYYEEGGQFTTDVLINLTKRIGMD